MQVLGVGSSFTYFVVTIGVLSGFYVANWEEHHTGVLKTNFKGVGVTESHLTIISLLVIQALTKGGFTEIAMHDIGRGLLPSVKEEHV